MGAVLHHYYAIYKPPDASYAAAKAESRRQLARDDDDDGESGNPPILLGIFLLQVLFPLGAKELPLCVRNSDGRSHRRCDPRWYSAPNDLEIRKCSLVRLKR